MQKETKEMLCTSCISFLSGVVITLIIFCCAGHLYHGPKHKSDKCPYAQQIRNENQFKHHNKLMGREIPKAPVQSLILPQNTP